MFFTLRPNTHIQTHLTKPNVLQNDAYPYYGQYTIVSSFLFHSFFFKKLVAAQTRFVSQDWEMPLLWFCELQSLWLQGVQMIYTVRGGAWLLLWGMSWEPRFPATRFRKFTAEDEAGPCQGLCEPWWFRNGLQWAASLGQSLRAHQEVQHWPTAPWEPFNNS